MAKTYGYAVIYNGVFYPPNTPIKEAEPKPKPVEEPAKPEEKPKRGKVKKNV